MECKKKKFLLTAHTHSCYSAHVFVSKLHHAHHWEGLNNCCSPTQMTSHLRGRYCEKGLDAHTHTHTQTHSEKNVAKLTDPDQFPLPVLS